jgi:hypothetical protein
MEKQVIQYALIGAVLQCDIDAINYCLNNGAIVTADALCSWIGTNGETLSKQVFQILMKNAPDASIYNKDFVYLCIKKENIYAMRLILKRNVPDQMKQYIMSESLEKNKLKIVKMFLKDGYNVRLCLVDIMMSHNFGRINILLDYKANLWICQNEIIKHWAKIKLDPSISTKILLSLRLGRYMKESNDFFKHYLLVTRSMGTILQSDVSDITWYATEYYKFVANSIHHRCLNTIDS